MRFLVLLVAFSLSWSGIAQARYYDDVIASGEIYIGAYKNFPPYSFERDGEPAGVDIEIGRRIAKAFNLTMKVHWITPDENLEDDLRNNVWKGHYLDKDEANPLAMKHLADVMMRVPYDREYAFKRDGEGLLINDQVVLFGPYQRERWQVAFDAEKIDRVGTVAVFQYHPVGVEIDSLPDFYLTSAFGGRMRKNTVHFFSHTEAFDAMLAGKVDAVMGMRAEVDWQLGLHNKPRYKLAENGFPSMGKQQWDIGMAVSQRYRQLGNEVDVVVEQLIRSGEIEKIYADYQLRYELPGLYQDVVE
ncbi:transporter substrate-binding domain-containing protein [Amphritea sp. 2_MG-2023]|uniref:substrate-binding periplasmic protein n=1 Tax=Amphritea TaxID=515417 RepID=UPI0020906584|nr:MULTISPECIES: transporter substrate-binding domain-containing protein [Amphritea]MDO6418611.1 transporter substrate-binding domain-containing protein [Amphritea sp. 2_MG-2023]MDX2423091.1 transporter substrate-binding domain-containing protein [Amphritea sp.]